METNTSTIKLGFIGFGDLGKQIAVLLDQCGYQRDNFFYFDDYYVDTNSFAFSNWKDPKFNDLNFLVALGYKHLRNKIEIISEVKDRKYKLFTFIHPSSYINPSANIEEGVIIYPCCNVDQFVTIQRGSFLNNSVCVSHHSYIKECCFLGPGAVVSGNVNIGKSTFLGSGSIISNDIKIGNNCIIGAGSVVTKDISDNVSAIGNPLKILKKPLQLV